MPQEFLELSQLNNIFGKDQVEETFGTPGETFSSDTGLPDPVIQGTTADSLFGDGNTVDPVPTATSTPPAEPAGGEPPVTVLPTNSQLNAVVSSLVASGEWEDVSLKVGDKEYNSVEELLQDKQIDIDLFDELLESQKIIKKEKIDSSYLKLDDPNSIKSNLAKAILQGQDYSDLIREKESTIDPISNLDFSFIPNDVADRQRAENDAANLLFWHHENNLGYNLQDEFVRKALHDKIDSLKNNFELLDAAETVKQAVITQYNTELQTRFVAEDTFRQHQQQERKQEIKKYKDNLKAKGYTDNFIKDVTSLRYEEDKTTSSPQYLSVIKAKVEADPEFATEILHFILDKEGYLGAQKLPEKLNTQRRMIEISGKAKKTSSNQPTGAAKQAQNESDKIILDIFGN